LAESVGINVDRLFTLTFAVGSVLPPLGGGSPSVSALAQLRGALSRAVPDRGPVGGLGSLKVLCSRRWCSACSIPAGKYLLADAGGFFILRTVVVLLISRRVLWRE